MVSQRGRSSAAVVLCYVLTLATALPSSGSEIDRATLEVLDKEMELLKLNTIYRRESTKQSKWKPWRQAFFRLAQYGTSFGGITTLASGRWQYWRTPARAPKHLFQTGPALLLVGHSIGLGGVALEAGLDAIQDHKLKKKGLDRKTFLKKVAFAKADILRSLSDRAQLLASLSPDEKTLADAEGRILQENLDCELAEAARYAVRHKRAVVGRHTGNVFATAGLTTGGYIGALMSTLASRYKKPHLAGAAGLGFTLSGAFIVMQPLATRAAQNYAAKREAAEIAQVIGPIDQKAASTLTASTNSFRALVTASSAETAARRAEQRMLMLQATEKMLTQQVAASAAESKQAKKDWLDRVAVNSIVGGTKMAYGIQLMNAGWSYPDPPAARPTVRLPMRVGNWTVRVTAVPAALGPAQIFHRRVASAATTFIPGLGVGILDTLQARIRGEARTRKLESEGKAPGQILKARLEKIDEIQRQIKADTVGP